MEACWGFGAFGYVWAGCHIWVSGIEKVALDGGDLLGLVMSDEE